MAHRRYPAWLAIALFGAAVACEDKSQSDAKPAASARPDSGVPHASGVDKNIAEAVAEIAGGAGPSASGPPATGVFSAGTADKEIKLGDPPKVALGGKGDGPTVRFGSGVPKKKFEGKVVVAVQTGPRSAMPTIELSVTMEPPSGEADKAPTEVVLRVSAAKPASDQPGDLPPGLDKQIAKIKGSRYHFGIAPNGAGRLTSIEISKDADPGLGPVLATAGDSLSIAFVPYPTEPVGVGAFWMVTSRDNFIGMDTISYRMMKLQKIDGDRATISASTKHYVVSGQLGFPGLPAHTVAEYNQTGNASILVPVAQPSLVQGEDTEELMANLALTGKDAPPGLPPGQPLPIRFELRSKFMTNGG